MPGGHVSHTKDMLYCSEYDINFSGNPPPECQGTIYDKQSINNRKTKISLIKVYLGREVVKNQMRIGLRHSANRLLVLNIMPCDLNKN